MFKTGIYKVDQLKDPRNFETIFGRGKKISITLYHQIIDDLDKSGAAEKILLNFPDSRRVFKRTYANRFEKFDAQTLKKIQTLFSLDQELVIHDAAVSDGRTACDFFETLISSFPKITYYASDYDPFILVLADGHTTVVTNSDEFPIEIIFPPFVFNVLRDAYCYSLNHLIKFILEKTVVKKILKKHRNGEISAKKHLLYCPKALMLAQNNPNFHLMRHNLLTPSPIPQPLSIFRAMNVLNTSYFNSDQMRETIEHIFDSLLEKGLFIVGSNQEVYSLVHGGIFLKNNNRFEKIEQSGEGSQIDSMILNFQKT